MEYKKELLSIIVPVYNKEKYLKRSLESILNQTYRNIEVIIIDDGSNDESLLICKKYAEQDSRIKLFTKTNGGVSSARNLGLDKCKGEYIAFVDPDDYLDLECFERLIDCLEKNSVDIAYCYAMDFWENSIRTFTYSMKTGTINVIQRDEFDWLDNRISHTVVWGAVYQRSIINGINFDKDLSIGEDTLFFAKCLKNSKNLAVLDLPLYHYSRNDDSVTRQKWTDSNISDLKARERIVDIFKENSILYKKAILGLAMTGLDMMSKYYYSKKFRDSYKSKVKRILKENFWELIKYNFGQNRCKHIIRIFLFLVSDNIYISLTKYKKYIIEKRK